MSIVLSGQVPVSSCELIGRLPLAHPIDYPPPTKSIEHFSKPPNPALSSTRFPKFPNKAQIEPRLGSANPLFDRKLLDILHEEGLRKKSDIYDGRR